MSKKLFIFTIHHNKKNVQNPLRVSATSYVTALVIAAYKYNLPERFIYSMVR